MLAIEADSDSDDWDGFWAEYSKALGRDLGEKNRRVIGGWDEGVEKGLPWNGTLTGCGNVVLPRSIVSGDATATQSTAAFTAKALVI